MSTPTDTNRDLLTVIAYMKAAPGKEDELREGLRSLIEPTAAEDGYVNYDLHESVEEPGVFFFYENWRPRSTSTPTWPPRTSSTSPAGSPSCSTTTA